MERKFNFTALGILLSSLLLYSFTLHPFFPIGDSGEFIVVAKTFGVSHPPGAPLYSIFSYLAAQVPISDVVFRLNFLSAIFGSLSATLLFLLLYKITENKFASLFGSISLLIAGLFWKYAIIAEVYTAVSFFMLLLLLVFYEWLRTKRKKYLYLLFFLGSSNLMIHYVSIGIVLPILCITLFKNKEWNFKEILKITISFLTGLIPIAIIPIAAHNHAFINWDNPSNLTNLIRFLTRADYSIIGTGDSFGSVNIYSLFSNYIGTLLKSFGIVTLILSLFAFLRKKHSMISWIIYIGFIILGPVYIIYAKIPPDSPYPDVAINYKRLLGSVYIFSYCFLALIAGLGIHVIMTKIKDKKVLSRIFVISLTLILIFNFYNNYLDVSSSRNTIFLDYGKSVTEMITRPTIIITGGEDANVFNYIQTNSELQNKNIKLVVFSLLQIPSYVEELKARYPEVNFPFKNIKLGENLDNFYISNLENFNIVFAPMDDFARQSFSDKFMLYPVGNFVRLISADMKFDDADYILSNQEFHNSFIKKLAGLQETSDLATNEELMIFARNYTNIGIVMNKLGETKRALVYLKNAQEIQPSYYTSFLISAEIYEKQKNYPNAIQEYLRMLTSNPNSPQAFRGLALDYYFNNDILSAKNYATKYLQYSKTPESRNEAEKLLQALQNNTPIILQ